MPVRIALVEDDPRIREALRGLLEGGGFRCVGCHPDAEEALRDLVGEAPDVLLLDIHLPGMDGVEAVAAIRQRLPDLPILMLTVFEDASRVFRALQNGANGYLVKRTAPEKLFEAIQEVRQGGAPMSPSVARKVVQYFHRQGPSPRPPENLTPREQEILALLARGALYKEIAGELRIGVETVRSHLSSIYGKLHVRTRTEAVVKYLGRTPDP